MRPVTNEYEENARLRKAQALASVLRALPDVKGDPGIAEHLGDDAWKLVARAAKVNVPSPTTREVVIGMLRNDRENEIADLFDFGGDVNRSRAAAAERVRNITDIHIKRERRGR